MIGLSSENKKRHRRDAFTLIELVIVLIIIGVMSAVAVPRLSGSMTRIQLDAAKRRVEIDIAQAQQRARFTGLQQKIDFNILNSKYLIQGMNDPDRNGQTYTVMLKTEPYNATITAANFGGNTFLLYDGYGQPLSSGYITLDVGGKSANVIVGKNGAYDIPIEMMPPIPAGLGM